MTRAILYLIATVLLIGVVRSILGSLIKGVADLFNPAASASNESASNGPRGKTAPLPTVDELKKDPVCGTFIAVSTALHKTVGGATYYFCSPECRDKFKA